MFTLTESMIRQRSSQQSFERGDDYYQSSSVYDCTRHGATFSAKVSGSQHTPYRVEFKLDAAGIQSSYCSCPYDWGGYCKHEIAAMLTYLYEPESFVEQVQVEPTATTDTLQELSDQQLRRLFKLLLEQKPELNEWLQVMLPVIQGKPTSTTPEAAKIPPPNTAAYRRVVQNAVSHIDFYRHWETIWETIQALGDAHKQAQAFLENEDYANALALMRIFGEEVIPDYEQIEEECQLADFLEDWADDFVEAILGAKLDTTESEQLSKQLTEWTAVLSDYGLDDTLDPAIAACVRGWDEPPSNDIFGINLTSAQLNILERQGDTESYLQLCLERGEHYRYLQRLLELEQTDKALEYARQHQLPATDFMRLGQFLRQQGQIETAYQMGLLGLSGTGYISEAARWLAELAEALGRLDTARRAWRAAFDDAPSIEVYQKLKDLSTQDWAQVRPQLMQRAREELNRSVLVKILIAEQAIAEAIQVWHKSPYGNYQLLAQLVEAAATSHPDWAIQQALKEAQSLIKKGSKYYPHVATWLRRVQTIYLQHNRAQEWQTTIAGIRQQHGRKYSLMSQIESL